MKRTNDWTISDVGWYVNRIRELLEEDPETAFEIIQKEKKDRMTAKHLEEPKIIND